MTPFDWVILLVVVISALSGFMTGMLRSLASVVAYVLATAIAVAATPFVDPMIGPYLPQTWMRQPGAFLIVFFAGVVVLGFLFQAVVSLAFGPAVSFGDRAAGLMLGVVRAMLVLTLVVVMFDRLIPRTQEPQWLAGSALRPLFSTLGAHGLRSLPSGVTEAIDAIRRRP
jgi:membrane protein required for colicin V production